MSQETVCRVLTKGWKSAREIAEELNASTTRVNRALSAMHKFGEVDRKSEMREGHRKFFYRRNCRT